MKSAKRRIEFHQAQSRSWRAKSVKADVDLNKRQFQRVALELKTDPPCVPTGLAMWHPLSEPRFPYLPKGSYYHSRQLGRGHVGDGQPCTRISVPQLVRLTCMNLRFKPETSVSSSAIWKNHILGLSRFSQGYSGMVFWGRPSLTCLKL